MNRQQDAEMEVAQMKMVSFPLVVNMLDRIRNELIRETAIVLDVLGTKREQTEMVWIHPVARLGVDCF